MCGVRRPKKPRVEPEPPSKGSTQMNKTNLLLSTAVGMAFVVAGPVAQAAGKKHPPQGNAKAHASINFAKSPFKVQKTRTPPPRQGLHEKFMLETWSVST